MRRPRPTTRFPSSAPSPALHRRRALGGTLLLGVLPIVAVVGLSVPWFLAGLAAGVAAAVAIRFVRRAVHSPSIPDRPSERPSTPTLVFRRRAR